MAHRSKLRLTPNPMMLAVSRNVTRNSSMIQRPNRPTRQYRKPSDVTAVALLADLPEMDCVDLAPKNRASTSEPDRFAAEQLASLFFGTARWITALLTELSVACMQSIEVAAPSTLRKSQGYDAEKVLNF